MANKSYLCTSDQSLIYPSVSEEGFDWKQQMIAEDASAIPLIWLMLFRESDIVEQDVPGDGNTTIRLCAPIAATDTAPARLPESLAAFSSILPEQRPLQPHADMMASLLSSIGGRLVTIEVSELENCIGTESFWALLRHCLRGFEDPDCWIPDPTPAFLRRTTEPRGQWFWPSSLFQITSLRFNIAFPAADLLLSRGPYSNDDLWNHGHLLGQSLYRPVPWEPAKA